MIYLTLGELLHVADRTLGKPPQVRDAGLLESALARPRASAFGDDAYDTLESKATALMHSISRNHALIDGNKRLALAATIAFLGLNGHRLTWSNDEAHDIVMSVATGSLDDVASIAELISSGTVDR